MDKKLKVNLVVLWTVYKHGPKIYRIVLAKNQRLSIKSPDPDGLKINTITSQVVSLPSRDYQFPLKMLRLDLCSAFQQKVLRFVHAIPRGEVTTYSLIANHLGNPGAARAVGMALAKNPFPLIIPCHRVVRSDGKLGGYQGGLKLKRALLKEEKIPAG